MWKRSRNTYHRCNGNDEQPRINHGILLLRFVQKIFVRLGIPTSKLPRFSWAASICFRFGAATHCMQKLPPASKMALIALITRCAMVFSLLTFAQSPSYRIPKPPDHPRRAIKTIVKMRLIDRMIDVSRAKFKIVHCDPITKGRRRFGSSWSGRIRHCHVSEAVGAIS